jgi:hypothetical protein
MAGDTIMILVRLLMPLKFHHHELEAGLVIGLPPDRAHRLIQAGIAEMAEPERAVVQPQEKRIYGHKKNVR